jgi:TonB family protein
LQLLVRWPNALAVFAGNLGDFLWQRTVPQQGSSSAPDYEFWQDVDLRTPFPLRGAVDSVLAHAALLGLLYAISIWPETGAHLEDPFTKRAMDGYSLSQYLPELHGAPMHRRAHGKHDPGLARQEIVSLARNPESLRQTIVAPPPLRLKQELALPNIVAVLPAQPISASERDTAKLRLPAWMPEVIAPAADTSGLSSRRRLPRFEPRVIEPAPEVEQATSRRMLPAFEPRVVEAAPDVSGVSRGGGSNLAHLVPRVGEPVPEAPQVGDAPHTGRQFIALNLHPAEVRGPVEVPAGNRSGEFAASPSGHAEASGTPGPDTKASGKGANESTAATNAPPGISVAAAANTAMGKATGAPLPDAPTQRSEPARVAAREALMAAARTPVLSPPPQRLARESTEPRSELEERIFAGKRSYKLTVNMPNLNAVTGSWIIHFVEHGAAHGSEMEPIAAPEVLHKSDPAYPGELMHDGVEGTVMLTATIRSDGSVGDIAIVKSLNPWLDANAAKALARWRFRPALKNGQAIEVEAVVTVPFRVKATRF